MTDVAAPLPPRQCFACGASTFLENGGARCDGCGDSPEACTCPEAIEVVDREEVARRNAEAEMLADMEPGEPTT